MFSTIDARIYIRNAKVLDLFAGSGNLGIEAISRGAKKVLFVDSDRRNIDHIEELSREFGIADQVRTTTSTAEYFLEGAALPYDIIFADPLYDYPLMDAIVTKITDEG